MAIHPRNLRILIVFVVTFCFAGGFVFSGYYEMDEVDLFASGLNYENPDLPTLSYIEKSLLNLPPGNDHFSLLAFSGFSSPCLEASSSSLEKINDLLRC
jgi:hypothetical protein